MSHDQVACDQSWDTRGPSWSPSLGFSKPPTFSLVAVWLRHVSCHSWTHVDKLLTHGSFHSFCPPLCSWPFFPPGYWSSWFLDPLQAQKREEKKKATTEGVGGLKAAILGTAGPGWSLLPPVPFPVTFFWWGRGGRYCERIRASCVSAHYMGWEGGDEGVNAESDGGKWKRKWKRLRMKERMTRGEGGREVAASTAAPSITLIQALIILFTHTHIHTAGELKHIIRHWGLKRQN